MKRYDHPIDTANPYPVPRTGIKGFKYESALVLLRLKDAVQVRQGEDADYLTGRPFVVSWRSDDDRWRQIVVPAGLITDLTSVPRPLRGIIGRVGPWLEAAILHDYLYIAWQDVPGRGAQRGDRRFADQMMRKAMREAGVGWLARWLIFGFVSTFGASSYAQRNAERYVDVLDPLVREQLAPIPPRMP